jgi:hypothetical protein
MKSDRLIFVYNADNGFFNALMDSAHKVFSPATYECSLCRFTYGLTGMLLPWKKFLDELAVEKAFLHRREFRRDFPQLQVELPAILRESRGTVDVLVTAAEIKQAGSLDGLIELVRGRLNDSPGQR